MLPCSHAPHPIKSAICQFSIGPWWLRRSDWVVAEMQEMQEMQDCRKEAGSRSETSCPLAALLTLGVFGFLGFVSFLGASSQEHAFLYLAHSTDGIVSGVLCIVYCVLNNNIVCSMSVLLPSFLYSLFSFSSVLSLVLCFLFFFFFSSLLPSSMIIQTCMNQSVSEDCEWDMTL